MPWFSCADSGREINRDAAVQWTCTHTKASFLVDLPPGRRRGAIGGSGREDRWLIRETAYASSATGEGGMSAPSSVAERPMPHVYDAAYAGVRTGTSAAHSVRSFGFSTPDSFEVPFWTSGTTGELSAFLARHGHDVLGIDLSPMAIQQATEKACWRRIDAHFLVWDALEIAKLRAADISFRTVVDSATFRVPGDRGRDRFVDGPGAVVASGGLYCVLGDARRAEGEIYRITPEEIRGRFQEAGGWNVVFSHRTAFERRWNTTPAYFVGVRRR